MHRNSYYVYVLANRAHGTLYTGVTNSLNRHMGQHKEGVAQGFTSKYRTFRLVYYETFESIRNAIKREKQIKAGSRQKKIELIETMNPVWKDLSAVWAVTH